MAWRKKMLLTFVLKILTDLARNLLAQCRNRTVLETLTHEVVTSPAAVYNGDYQSWV